ncbi:hypothetical protein ERICIV_00880 [Paenibacillus larvae subsp. larvae]|uniref:Uncharacterized protein n=1 Tax=Paenibacillus larvae subsp. larvae TaxID=147375 RepID=A0A2L1TWR2_9BACL|nr:hypothetical protein B1222_16745 [Paenibacillus larvae subsp. pulvifaciens]AVF25084.1 hypothetical protein ERICIII_00877 [Paenibacillus larvae subsp. larvae]AVF29848.1 hypothetical protein ERICIV_00880 [Paenibacillus larvae subsp. larvae]MBH0342279.1 hypothetical protein [Paenibacillus larvae]
MQIIDERHKYRQDEIIKRYNEMRDILTAQPKCKVVIKDYQRPDVWMKTNPRLYHRHGSFLNQEVFI